MSIDMTLQSLLNQVRFDKVFSDIIRHVPKVETKRDQFLLAFDTLRSIIPTKESDFVIEAYEQDYLGEGVHDIWINAASTLNVNLWVNLLAGQIKLSPKFNRPDASCKITNKMIIADLL